jgi:hypothetical protein
MHTTTFLSVLSASISLLTITAAAPAAFPGSDPTVCPTGTGYYQKCSNGYTGCCTTDACSLGWCPGSTGGSTESKPAPASECFLPAGKSGYYQRCGNNNFNGYCSVDACSLSWCPDYQTGTCTPRATSDSGKGKDGKSNPNWPAPAADCPSISTKSTTYYVCGSNSFRGYCSVDACNLGWCPDFETKTCTPVSGTTPTTPEEPKEPKTPKENKKQQSQYVCASNGFNGLCSVDACNLPWCPDYKLYTYEPIVVV